jgi:hypothetical protein
MTKAGVARRAEAGRALNALRKTHAGGRQKVLRQGPQCGTQNGQERVERTAAKRSLQLQAAAGKASRPF